MHTEIITWRAAAPDSLPDADLVVNVATEGCDEPIWLGSFDGVVWRDTEGMEIHVTHWAPMLAGPDVRIAERNGGFVQADVDGVKGQVKEGGDGL